MGAFADADSGGAEEQEGIRFQIVGSTQFLLHQVVLLERKRSGKIAGLWRKILRTNKFGEKGVALGGQVLQQPPETIEMNGAGSVTEGRSVLAQRTEPAEEMGIAAQLRELVHLRERGMEIGEEVAYGTAIVGYRAGLQGEGKRLDLRFEDLFETGLALTHERCEASNYFRLWTACSYSRQTSCGASWT